MILILYLRPAIIVKHVGGRNRVAIQRIVTSYMKSLIRRVSA